ncbi:MAG: 3-methylornithyl-N6-L-lysine dehydrogenase PylD [Desulfobacterales bacterium]|jgi:pyrrolysine biosynthesis protein PylD
MTRLTVEDIGTIAAGLKDYDRELRAKTGRTLLGVACHAASIPAKTIARRLGKIRLAVIPISAGKGTIPGFSESLVAIGSHLGLNAFLAGAKDAAGVAEAVERKANWLWMSDDDRFVLVDLMRRRVVDNSVATGRGFAAGLDLMAGGVAGKPVAVIGCGPVGLNAARMLMEFKAQVTLHDIRRRQAAAAAAVLGQEQVQIATDFSEVVAGHDLLVDATNMGALIPAMAITASTFIAAPGMPLGVTSEARARLEDHLLHDPLPLGAATMVAMALISGK